MSTATGNMASMPMIKPRVNFSAIIKESILAALAAALLASGLVGLNTTEAGGIQLTITYRIVDVIAAALVVGLGRFAMALTRVGLFLPALIGSFGVAAVWIVALSLPDDAALRAILPFQADFVNGSVALAAIGLGIWTLVRMRGGGLAVPAGFSAAFQTKNARFLIGLIVLIAVVSLPHFESLVGRKELNTMIYVMIYIMLAWGLNIVVGLAGLLDLGYVAFYAVGAYSFALMSQYWQFGFWESLPIAGILAATFGIVLGFPVLRLRGDYLAIVTLGFGEMIRLVLVNWSEFTGGPQGLSNIPKPTFFGIDIAVQDRSMYLFYIILTLALLINFLSLRLRRLPIGRAWEALREDETACRALGINPTNTKLTAFALGAFNGGLAGPVFAAHVGFISPESFNFLESAVILAIVVLGGLGSQVGVMLAALLLVGVPDYFRELQDYRLLAFGLGMVLIMIWRPRGLLSHREPTIKLHSKAMGT